MCMHAVAVNGDCKLTIKKYFPVKCVIINHCYGTVWLCCRSLSAINLIMLSINL